MIIKLETKMINIKTREIITIKKQERKIKYEKEF